MLEMKDRQGHLRGSGRRKTAEGSAGVSFRKKVLSNTLKKTNISDVHGRGHRCGDQ